MEGKCMRCGKPEHQPGQKCAAKNAKCKERHKIGHFHKVCQSKKRGKRVNLVQATNQDDSDTHSNEDGVRQPNPPTLETQLQIFLYWDSFTPTCSLGEKSI